MKPTIKECFYLNKKGRCCSPEIYRKVEGMDTGKLCPFKLDDLVFGTNNPYDMKCLEFTPKRESFNESLTMQNPETDSGSRNTVDDRATLHISSTSPVKNAKTCLRLDNSASKKTNKSEGT